MPRSSVKSVRTSGKKSVRDGRHRLFPLMVSHSYHERSDHVSPASSSDDDTRIHRQRAVGVGEDGVQVQFVDLRVCLNELRDLKDKLLERGEGRGQLPPPTFEDREALDLA